MFFSLEHALTRGSHTLRLQRVEADSEALGCFHTRSPGLDLDTVDPKVQVIG